MSSNSNNKYVIQSVLRALDLLVWLAEHEGRGRLTEISQDLGYQKNTTFRLLYTLIERGFVRQTDDAGYELTFKLLTLGESVIRSTDIHHVARPHIQELARKCGESVTLAILDGNEVIYLDRVLGSARFNTSYSIGSRAKAYTTALGKAILAFSPGEVVERCAGKELLANTQYTIVDAKDLRQELEETARRGYALDNQENVLGIRCIGAPIFDRKGEVIAAISISGLAVNMTDERVKELIDPMLDTASTISAQMGFDGVRNGLYGADGNRSNTEVKKREVDREYA